MGLDFFRKKKKVWGGGNHSRLKRLKRYKNPVAIPIPSLDPGLKKKKLLTTLRDNWRNLTMDYISDAVRHYFTFSCCDNSVVII